MITIKTDAELNCMRESGRLTKNVLELLGKSIRVGMTTKELDKIAFDYIKSCGATPSFLGYGGYPASICASIDEMVVHGIPSDETIIKDGQLVSIDVGVIYNGWHGDAARTFMVGNVSEEKKRLVKVTEECFFKAIEHLSDGSPLGNIGYNVQTHAESNGYSVVRALVGHGIGREMHEDPSVPNYGKKGTGIRLKKGMTIAIEPMINMGSYQVDFLRDGWSVVTRDRLPSAHYENTVAITDNGVEILTL
ncbi:MAG: type I methionyl aminopeptidase [Clostridiales bacterium]|nr:type I methionyl aminopeptidase [Clostridiales bacterium]